MKPAPSPPAMTAGTVPTAIAQAIRSLRRLDRARGEGFRKKAAVKVTTSWRK